MGFFGEFAYGFAKTAQPIIEAQGKAQAEADARIREKVQSVQPETELYQRRKDIDAAEALSLQKAGMDQMASFMKDNGYGTNTPAAPTADTTATPDQTIATPAVNMTPSSATPQPFTPTAAAPNPQEDAFSRMQKHTQIAGVADAAGLPHLAKAATVAATLDKNEYDHNKDLATEAAKPVLSAEGLNIGEQINKDFEKHVANVGEKSWYTTKANDVPMSSPDAQAKEQEIFETIHAPLTQAFIEAQKTAYPNSKVTQTYAAMKNQTIKATQAVATLTSTDARVAADDKAKANVDLEKIFKKVYGSPQNLAKAAGKDQNLSSVLDMISNSNQEKPDNVMPNKPQDNSSIPTVTSDADYSDVPPGSQYIDPNGNTRTKPQAK